ncbi:hypothetical protein V8D89_011068 [Ganoderma adspersum]
MGRSHGSTESIGNLVRHSLILPSDIIAQVYKELFDSVPGPDQYDLSLTRVAPDQWAAEQRFRKGLTLVSRLWWEPATKALYEHVVLRHVNQIAAFARTLRMHPEDAKFDFGAMVRRITLHECVVVFPECNIVDEDVRTIFERCVALEELSLHRRPDGVDVIADSDDRVHPPWARVNPIWIFPQLIVPALHARGLTMLRKLDLNPNLAVALYNLISTSPHLTTLAVQNLKALGPDLPSLQSLEELTLRFPYRAPPHSPRKIWQWTLPRLRSLTILSYIDYDNIPIPVLEALGRTLTYLHIHDFTYCADRNLTTLPALCPALEHLITNEPDAAMWDAERAAALLTHARARIAPALEGVRALLVCSPGLPYALPTICHPSVMRKPTTGAGAGLGSDRDASRLVCVRDVWVLQTAWCVPPLAEWWLDEDMWLEDDLSDYVYESPSTDSAEGSDWDSDSDSELSEGTGVIGP